jgi:hypothetical protein
VLEKTVLGIRTVERLEWGVARTVLRSRMVREKKCMMKLENVLCWVLEITNDRKFE